MSYLVPAWEVSMILRLKYRIALTDQLTQRLVHLKVAGPDSVHIRKLTAEDVGLAAWRTPSQPEGEETTWIRAQVKENSAWGFFKIVQNSTTPKVSNMRFTYSKSQIWKFSPDLDEMYSIVQVIKELKTMTTEDRQNVERMFGGLEGLRAEAYFTLPIVYDPNDWMSVVVKSCEPNPEGDRLMLVGLVAEPEGQTVM